jgi:hypothetical protein
LSTWSICIGFFSIKTAVATRCEATALSASFPPQIDRRGSLTRSIARICATLWFNWVCTGEQSMFENAFMNIDNTLRTEAGCQNELDYIEQTS